MKLAEALKVSITPHNVEISHKLKWRGNKLVIKK